MSNNTVKVINFDMNRLESDYGQATRIMVGNALTKVYQKNGNKKEAAIKEMLALASTYSEYVLDWAGYEQPNLSKPQSKSNKESEMKTEKVVEVIDEEVVESETTVDAATYQEFLEFQEFKAWKAKQEREKYSRRPIDTTPPRIENKVVFATPAPRQPEVKFVSPVDIMKAQVFIKGQVAKVVHEAEKAYFMSCEWHGTERIAEDVTVDLTALMQPVTEERGLAIAKSAFENALENAMHDRFGSGWEYQLESAGVVNPMTVAKAVFRMM